MRIGIGPAIFVNIFDPQVIAIGGGVSAVGDLPFDIAVYGLSGEIHPAATPQLRIAAESSGCLPSANKGKIRSAGWRTP